MADRKKLSGAQYRKRKADREIELSKLKGSFEKFLCPPESSLETAAASSSTLQKDYDIGVPHRDIEANSREQGELVVVKDSLKDEDFDQSNRMKETEVSINIDYSDPASWEHLSISRDQLRTLLVENGPQQSYKQFPVDERKRKFSAAHYKRKLPNGEEVSREYLQYSVSTDKVFCFCCKIFGGNPSSSLTQKGCNDWHNISAILSSHEESFEHITNFYNWKGLYTRLKKDITIDSVNMKKLKEEEKYWQQILERVISLVRVLGAQNLAFRGSSDKLYAHNNGNFLKIVELFALFDPIMNEHLRRIQNRDKRHAHYLGNIIQNELIQVLSNAIKDKIILLVKNSKYFSIILDCTPDISHMEQMTMIIRFVDISQSSGTESFQSSDEESPKSSLVQIKEHFLGFVPLTETTGESMSHVLINQLQSLSLSIEDLRGQGYDNGSNMKSKESGLQKKILDINPCAFYVPCSSHTLNLVVNDAASCCTEAASFFDIIQRLYVFFAASPRRWDVLKHHIPSLTLKPLSATRWSSRIDALTPIRYQLPYLYDALFEITEDSTLKGSSGTLTKLEAEGLLSSISSFKFVVAVVTWHSILFQINVTSKLLQETHFTLEETVNELKNTEEFLKNMRSDEEFEKVLVDARELAEEINIEPIFEPEIRRRKRKLFAYESEDEPITDPKEKFRVNYYFAILDTAICSVKERFTQLNGIASLFGFLYNISDLKMKTSKELMDLCIKLETALTRHIHADGETPSLVKDIDAVALCSELSGISHRIQKDMKPECVLNYLCQNKLENGFPNLFIALRILLTLPISVASAERSFSKLKLIKTYLRSSMSQERLVGLATISIERDMAYQLDVKNLIKDFAKLKARNVSLY